jgi:methyl-accepting chemotaxis protein
MRIDQKNPVTALSGLFVLGLIIVTASVYALQHRGQEEIAAERRLMLTEKTQRLKNLVEVAISNLKAGNARGDLSLEARQNLAKNLISSMRYNTSDYLWINDMQAVIVRHPIKQTNAAATASTKLQQNSAHVNASAGDLAGLARTLVDLMGRFSV